MFVPKGITFETLREQTSRQMEKLVAGHNNKAQQEMSHDQGSVPLTVDIVELETPKMHNLRDKLVEVNNHATTQSQRERYLSSHGVRAWHDDYIFLTREAQWQQVGKLSGSELVKEVWGRFSSTRFGRFQRAFSYEYSTVAPRRIFEDADKRWSTHDRGEWRDHLNTRSLAGALVSPDLIPNRLAARLGLIEWQKGTTPWSAIELKNSVAVIDGLKMIFESSAPLVKSNTRIWLLPAPGVAAKLRYPDAKLPDSKLEGTFIYFRGDDATQPRPGRRGSKESFFQREIPAYFDSVYALYRATLHKSERYEQEVVALSSLAQSAQELNIRLATDWRKEASTELRQEMKDELASLLQRAEPILLGMKHIAKKEAGELLQAMQHSLAELPKNADVVVKNMRAMLPRIVALRSRLADRGLDIPRKSRWNTEDQLHIRDYITRQEQVFKDLHESVLRSVHVVNRHRAYFDRAKPYSPEQVAHQTKVILQSLNIRRERLAAVTARPLVTFAKAMNLIITELEQSVAKRDRPGTETALVKLLVVSKLEQANACVERLKRFTTYCNVTFDSFEKASADLLEALAKREIFPVRSVPEFQHVYGPIQRTFTQMVKRFNELKKSSLSDDARIVVYGRIRTFLDHPERDLEQSVARLVGLELKRNGTEDETATA